MNFDVIKKLKVNLELAEETVTATKAGCATNVQEERRICNECLKQDTLK